MLYIDGVINLLKLFVVFVGTGNSMKEHEADGQADSSTSIQLEPVTVEFSVELEKWLLPPQIF